MDWSLSIYMETVGKFNCNDTTTPTPTSPNTGAKRGSKFAFFNLTVSSCDYSNTVIKSSTMLTKVFCFVHPEVLDTDK